jgi:hypothetical protein
MTRIELELSAEGQYLRRRKPPQVVTDYDTEGENPFLLSRIHIAQDVGEDHDFDESNSKTKLWL